MKHWEKVLELKDMKFKMKKLNPFDFSAFKMVYAKALNDNDPVSLSKAYKTLISWVEVETGMTGYISLYDSEADKFNLPVFNEQPLLVDSLVDLVLTDVIMPFMTATIE